MMTLLGSYSLCSKDQTAEASSCEK